MPGRRASARARRLPLALLVVSTGLPVRPWPGPRAQPAPAPEPPPLRAVLAELREEARALEPLVESELARSFLGAVAALPQVAPRTLLRTKDRARYYTPAQAAALPEAERRLLEEVALDEAYYDTTRCGTPLAYARPLDLAAAAGLASVSGRRILDFGYGTIGHLRMLASLGADVVGVEVDPLLQALYGEPGDQGSIPGWKGRGGTLGLVHGFFPSDEAVRRAVGEGYDLFIAKNTLKKGFIHPAVPVEARRMVHLGVEEEVFLRTLHGLLKPGGLAIVYNLSPAPPPPGTPYIPWADGRSSFPRSLWEAAGFRVLAFDEDDGAAARRMGRALGWDRGSSPMALEQDLFAAYTLAQRPARP